MSSSSSRRLRVAFASSSRRCRAVFEFFRLRVFFASSPHRCHVVFASSSLLLQVILVVARLRRLLSDAGLHSRRLPGGLLREDRDPAPRDLWQGLQGLCQASPVAAAAPAPALVGSRQRPQPTAIAVTVLLTGRVDLEGRDTKKTVPQSEATTQSGGSRESKTATKLHCTLCDWLDRETTRPRDHETTRPRDHEAMRP